MLENSDPMQFQKSAAVPDLDLSFHETASQADVAGAKLSSREEIALTTVRKALLLNGLISSDEFISPDGGPQLILHRSGINIGILVDSKLFARVSDKRTLRDVRRELLVIELLKLMRCNVITVPSFPHPHTEHLTKITTLLKIDTPIPGNPCQIFSTDPDTGGDIRTGIVSFFGVFQERAEARQARAALDNFDAFGRSLARIHKAGNLLGIHRKELYLVAKNLALEVEDWDQRRKEKLSSLSKRFVSMDALVAEDLGLHNMLPKYNLIKRIEHAISSATPPTVHKIAAWEHIKRELLMRMQTLTDEYRQHINQEVKSYCGLLHGDAHIGNVLFGFDPDGNNDHVIADFEWVGLGHPAWDLVPVAVAVRRFGIGNDSFLRFLNGFHNTILERGTFWERGQSGNIDEESLHRLSEYVAADRRDTPLFRYMESVRELAMTAFAFNWWKETLPAEKREQLWEELLWRLKTLDAPDALWKIQ